MPIVDFPRFLASIEETADSRASRVSDFSQAMKEGPRGVALHVESMLSGGYGSGVKIAAKEKILNTDPKTYRAWLTHVAGALGWGCPLQGAIDGFNQLTKRMRCKMNKHVYQRRRDVRLALYRWIGTDKTFGVVYIEDAKRDAFADRMAKATVPVELVGDESIDSFKMDEKKRLRWRMDALKLGAIHAI